MSRRCFLAAVLALALVANAVAQPVQPNIVVIMVDDLSVDAYEALLAAGLMPELDTRVVQQGLSLSNAYATNPICCPSRATYLTGQYSHNHKVFTNVSGIGWAGWFPDGANPGREAQALPVWLQNAGYVTGHIGKYLNGYGQKAPVGVADPQTYIPPGWNNWQGLIDPNTYKVYDYELSDNGTVVAFGDLEADYQTDVLAGRAAQFVLDQAGSGQPFFLNVAPLAPHIEVLDILEMLSDEDPLGAFSATIRPALRHLVLTDGDPGNGEVPELVLKPSYNEADLSDKASCPRTAPGPGIAITFDPVCVGDKPLLDPLVHEPLLKAQYKDMLASMVAVDDLIGDILDALDAIGATNDTVIVFTSDNGWFYGEHRLSGKSLGYDEAARVPLVVRGPNTVSGAIAAQIVLNNDLAPTIADLAGATPLLVVDGASIAPVLADPSTAWFRRNFLTENWFQASYLKFEPATSFSLRINNGSANALYVNVHADTAQPGLVTGYELYDLNADPHAMESFNVPQSLITALQPFMDFMRGCSGDFCRTLEGL